MFTRETNRNRFERTLPVSNDDASEIFVTFFQVFLLARVRLRLDGSARMAVQNCT